MLLYHTGVWTVASGDISGYLDTEIRAPGQCGPSLAPSLAPVSPVINNLPHWSLDKGTPGQVSPATGPLSTHILSSCKLYSGNHKIKAIIEALPLREKFDPVPALMVGARSRDA